MLQDLSASPGAQPFVLPNRILTLFDAMETALAEDLGLATGEAQVLISSLERTIATRARREAGQGLVAWQVRRIEAHVAARITSPITVRELAQVLRLSAGRFSRSFKARFGQSPRAWIALQRIRRAKRLMRQSRAGLSEIALECGFADQAHFTNTFRRATGMPPGAWRRAIELGDA
ncbi:AraC family transcriptional regulator [Caulobacter segnis]|uniref:Transcriptional regulator, AraC family n=2 Tax=Caulobacter segnis TaxID=88688 RepID=D5VE35_CAUST|nr:AraC family transcriptional regulator [Caulobacter segnis]ADG08735.1 transcriptional regulator, AraC family [Caulobacter segnis ATCC 21756]AVQ00586.1 AraC family transcriptional regulator [Caulobacter segnis]